MPSDFEPHVIDNPPMPWEEYRAKELRSFARKIVVIVFASLLLAAIVYPWKPSMIERLIVLGLFALAGVGMALVSSKGRA